jgi:hypothetical protein
MNACSGGIGGTLGASGHPRLLLALSVETIGRGCIDSLRNIFCARIGGSGILLRAGKHVKVVSSYYVGIAAAIEGTRRPEIPLHRLAVRNYSAITMTCPLIEGWWSNDRKLITPFSVGCRVTVFISPLFS